MLAQLLSPAASERLSRIRLVKPAKARQVEEAVIGAARAGRISGPLDEDGLKALLQQFAAVNERKPSITVRGACSGVRVDLWRRACGLVLRAVINGEMLSGGDRVLCDVCVRRAGTWRGDQHELEPSFSAFFGVFVKPAWSSMSFF